MHVAKPKTLSLPWNNEYIKIYLFVKAGVDLIEELCNHKLYLDININSKVLVPEGIIGKELCIQWNFPITDNLGAGILSFI